ncbi:cyclin-dependent kinase regulatory subunit-domain-containing protein [Polychytrium aggregatum]|uniref:cyclin-dependent kinase regulatory subunit-domain-containing protein n=1 Tax=Polychytrium aggregatum TaxID=110093 RepID=UPI0022FE4C60|nr:cyclin-dependent kinase regulatory subunit-domain-containing protein [Polychytrium aggregatum]KAI9204053.1 cyclin-dependent kinase regulatory subunit-domain-containing protein [Polychytrium aggregatum]
MVFARTWRGPAWHQQRRTGTVSAWLEWPPPSHLSFSVSVAVFRSAISLLFLPVARDCLSAPTPASSSSSSSSSKGPRLHPSESLRLEPHRIYPPQPDPLHLTSRPQQPDRTHKSSRFGIMTIPGGAGQHQSQGDQAKARQEQQKKLLKYQRQKEADVNEYEKEIIYSDKYSDDIYEYRHVMLPQKLAQYVPQGRLMPEDEWRSLGVMQSRGWIHYMVHNPEPHILLFRRELNYGQN